MLARTRAGAILVRVLKRRTAKTVELAPLVPDGDDRAFPAVEVAWMARIVWASQ